MKILQTFLVIILCITGYNQAFAQNTGSLGGKVFCFEKNEPIGGVLIKLENTTIATHTDKEGVFLFKDLPPGVYTIICLKSDRYSTMSDPVEIFAGKHTAVELQMLKGEPDKFCYFSIGGITVTADRDMLPESHETVHKISSGEIEHMQATNLGDILDLIPSVDRRNRPGLNSQLKVSLRGGGEEVNEQPDLFGTRIIVDDIPVSNNANLNTGTGVGYGSNVRSIAESGIDLRTLPADNVSEVEVVAGVPSVEYGDMTGGIIRVKTRAGVDPMRLKMKNNPDTREVNFGGGLQLAPHSTFNYNLNDAYSLRDLRIVGDEVHRVSLQGNLGHKFLQDKLELTEQVRFTRMFEDYSVKDDPLSTSAYNHDHFWVFGQSAEYRFNKRTSVYWRAYLNYTLRESNVRRMEFTDPVYVSDRMTDGTQPAHLITERYAWEVNTTGKEYSGGAKLQLKHRILTMGTVHNMLFGTEYLYEANRGAGKQFNPLQPPYGSTGRRPRTFDDVPPFRQFSLYAENRISGKIIKPFTLTLGIRGESYNPEGIGSKDIIRSQNGTFWNPRMGLMVKLTPDLQLRGSYGISSKAPAMSHIYPGPVYYDVLEYGQVGDSSVVLMTTYVHRLNNEDLKGYRQRKYEGGVDYRFGNFSFSLVGYWQKTEDAPTSVLLPYTHVQYFYPDWPDQQNKELVHSENITLTNYERMENLNWNLRRGLEFTLRTRRIAKLNMMFRVSGSYAYNSHGREDALSVSNPKNVWFVDVNGDSVQRSIFPVYQRDSGWNKRLIMNYNLDYINKKLGIWLTFTLYHRWLEKSLTYDTSEKFKYASHYYLDGQYYPLSREQAKNWNFYSPYDESQLEVFPNPSTYYFNLTVSKNIFHGMEVSLFVNNLLNQRNFYENKYGSLVAANPEIFYGIEFSMMVEPLAKYLGGRFFNKGEMK